MPTESARSARVPAPPGALRSRVPAHAVPARLIDLLATRFGYLSREAWRARIEAGRVTVDGRTAGPDCALRAGQVLAYRPDRSDLPEPVAVLYEDSDLVVVDKPAAAVCHRVSAFPHRTFVTALEQRLQTGAARVSLEFAHRLDRGTSGAVILTKHPAAAAALYRQFAAGTVHKEYLAVVHGSFADDRLVIELPIGRAPRSSPRARRAVLPAGMPGALAARTDIEVLARGADRTLIRAVPRTGRTHQIRVHLQAIGHPIVGDLLYGNGGGDSSSAVWEDYADRLRDGADAFARQLLHASRLSLTSPATGVPLSVEAPLPDDFRAAAPRR